MFLTQVTEFVPIALAVVISGAVSFFFSRLLMKIHRLLIFLIPGMFGAAGAGLWILGLLADDWSTFGFLLYGSLAAVVFAGSLVASLILWFKNRKKGV